jgi:hypothetical protein
MLLWSKYLQKKLNEAKIKMDLSSFKSSFLSVLLSVLGYQLKISQNTRPTGLLFTSEANVIVVGQERGSRMETSEGENTSRVPSGHASQFFFG